MAVLIVWQPYPTVLLVAEILLWENTIAVRIMEEYKQTFWNAPSSSSSLRRSRSVSSSSRRKVAWWRWRSMTSHHHHPWPSTTAHHHHHPRTWRRSRVLLLLLLLLVFCILPTHSARSSMEIHPIHPIDASLYSFLTVHINNRHSSALSTWFVFDESNVRDASVFGTFCLYIDISGPPL